MLKHIKAIVTTLTVLAVNISAQAKDNNPDSMLITPVLPISEMVRADSVAFANRVLYAERTTIDSLLDVWLESRKEVLTDSLFNLNADWQEPETGSKMYLPDSVYIKRLNSLTSPIPLVYNQHVKQQIQSLTTTRRTTVSLALGRSLKYFPMIEAELDAAGIPLEFRILPVIESALIPTARSRMGAMGIWQFMLATGRNYGLEITSFVDQRRDPIAATKAACRYLQDMYRIFGDWTLALAAYNCGPGNINKAIKRAGGKRDFWEIYTYLPRETRNYVPIFIAMTYAFHFHNQHDIEPQDILSPFETDTVMVNRIMHLEQISSTIDIPLDVLQTLNPQYKLDIIPANEEKGYALTLPRQEVPMFLVNEQLIMSKDTTYLAQYMRTSKETGKVEFNIESTTYVVKRGDTLGGIAARHNVTVSQLMKWNNIKSTRSVIRPGQRLEIFL